MPTLATHEGQGGKELGHGIVVVTRGHCREMVCWREFDLKLFLFLLWFSNFKDVFKNRSLKTLY